MHRMCTKLISLSDSKAFKKCMKQKQEGVDTITSSPPSYRNFFLWNWKHIYFSFLAYEESFVFIVVHFNFDLQFLGVMAVRQSVRAVSGINVKLAFQWIDAIPVIFPASDIYLFFLFGVQLKVRCPRRYEREKFVFDLNFIVFLYKGSCCVTAIEMIMTWKC